MHQLNKKKLCNKILQIIQGNQSITVEFDGFGNYKIVSNECLDEIKMLCKKEQ